MKRVYIAAINDLVTDQRLNRIAGLLKGEGMEVTCIGRRLGKSPALTGYPFRAKRYRMLFTRGPFFYACFNLRLLITLLLSRRPSLIIANDLDTLPASFMAGRIRRARLIYDSHEFFTQVPELIGRKRIQAIWKWIENRYVPRVEYAVTVSFPIATIYRRLYGTRFSVVRNVPRKLEPVVSPVIREQYKGKRMIIYQGSLNIGRGLELMIRTMHYVDGAVFIIAGSGDIEQKLKRIVSSEALEERVVFTGRLLPEQLLDLTMSCDLGISLEEDLGLNYRYALPNKLFDYIQCQVPVLCSALPEMSRIVRSYGVGIATEERDPVRLAGIVRYMLDERAQGSWMEALNRAAGELCWENESGTYRALLVKCGLLD